MWHSKGKKTREKIQREGGTKLKEKNTPETPNGRRGGTPGTYTVKWKIVEMKKRKAFWGGKGGKGGTEPQRVQKSDQQEKTIGGKRDDSRGCLEKGDQTGVSRGGGLFRTCEGMDLKREE